MPIERFPTGRLVPFRVVHSPEFLEAFVEHVAYEISQLQLATGLIGMGKYPTVATPGGPSPSDESRVVGNALLESVLLHLRALDDFLGKGRPAQPNDVLAVDYLGTWQPKRILTGSERDYVNWRLAHLTTERNKGPAPWQLARSLDALAEIKSFLDDLDGSAPARATWFRRWVQW